MEFELEGRTYRASTIDARKQFHIVRRLAPVLGELAPALQGTVKGDGLAAIPPLANAIANLSDDDADYVLFGLLAVVSRKQDQGLGWGPVCAGTAIMYEDINMVTMLKLAWQAFQFNMSGFFAALPSDLKEAAQKVSAP